MCVRVTRGETVSKCTCAHTREARTAPVAAYADGHTGRCLDVRREASPRIRTHTHTRMFNEIYFLWTR